VWVEREKLDNGFEKLLLWKWKTQSIDVVGPDGSDLNMLICISSTNEGPNKGRFQNHVRACALYRSFRPSISISRPGEKRILLRNASL
jgi:hypothetical protein